MGKLSISLYNSTDLLMLILYLFRNCTLEYHASVLSSPFGQEHVERPRSHYRKSKELRYSTV